MDKDYEGDDKVYEANQFEEVENTHNYHSGDAMNVDADGDSNSKEDTDVDTDGSTSEGDMDVETNESTDVVGNMDVENDNDNNEEEATGYEGLPDDYYCSDPSENEELDAAYNLGKKLGRHN
ncbi:hypothetical protein GGI06_000677 [Coemansia sp. S85]|nr:hypothetical protein GGI06_000677 [Coemansia sp. S85]